MVDLNVLGRWCDLSSGNSYCYFCQTDLLEHNNIKRQHDYYYLNKDNNSIISQREQGNLDNTKRLTV